MQADKRQGERRNPLNVTYVQFDRRAPGGRGNRRMQKEDTTVLAALIEWFHHAYPAISAVFLSVSVACVRVIYEDMRHGRSTTFKQTAMESILCGLLTVSLVSGAQLIGVPESAATFIGGAVGFLGVEKVREVAENWVGKKSS